MPGCAAVGCTNSARKGFCMKAFPKDPVRRQQWVANLNRSDFTAVGGSRLCEVHFAPEMWEKTREDGSKKLKLNAVPTIFDITEPTKRRKLQTPVGTSQNASEAIPCIIVSSDSEESVIEVSDGLETECNPIWSVINSDDETYKQQQCIRTLNRLVRSRNRLRYAKHRIKLLERRIKRYKACSTINNIFSDDQLSALNKKTFVEWSDETIIKSLKLRFACGHSGYEELLKQNLPYATVQTLAQKLKNSWTLNSGILDEVFDFLKYKVSSFENNEHECALILEELTIIPGEASEDATLPEHCGVPTGVLVFTLTGINLNWKQIAAYYFVGSSVDGTRFNEILCNIFYKASCIGLNIVAVTTDLSSCHQVLWQTLGIEAGRHEIMKNSIRNPVDVSKKVFFLADVDKLFKSLKAAFTTTNIITISQYVQQKHGLPTNVANASHISDLVALQERLMFRLAPKDIEADLMPPDYDETKISKSQDDNAHDVISALNLAAKMTDNPKYITTAWFIENCEKWYRSLTCSSPVTAINTIDIEECIESFHFLNNFMEIIDNMEIGPTQSWVASQGAILVTTKSAMQIQELLLERHQYQLVITARFTQGNIENLFNVLAEDYVLPSVSQVKKNLTLISIAQYLKCPTRSNKHEDEMNYLLNFWSNDISLMQTAYNPVQIPDKIGCNFSLNFSEIDSLYNIAGYLVDAIRRQTKTCSVCIAELGSAKPQFKHFSEFSLIRPYRVTSLFYCHETIFYFFVELESVFRKYYEIVSSQNVDIKTFFIDKMMEIDCSIKSECHNIKYKVVSRYVTFRLKQAMKKKAKLLKRQIN